MKKPKMWEWSTGYVQFLQDWSEWLTGDFNWRNFHLIVVEYEDECWVGNREVVAYLLGFGIRICWVYDTEADGRKLIEKRMRQVKFHPDIAVDLKDIQEQLHSSDNGEVTRG